jgi:hypothetical protein
MATTRAQGAGYKGDVPSIDWTGRGGTIKARDGVRGGDSHCGEPAIALAQRAIGRRKRRGGGEI